MAHGCLLVKEVPHYFLQCSFIKKNPKTGKTWRGAGSGARWQGARSRSAGDPGAVSIRVFTVPSVSTLLASRVHQKGWREVKAKSELTENY